MKKDSLREKTALLRLTRQAALFLAVAFFMFAPKQAAAQCEIASSGNQAMNQLAHQDIQNLNLFLTQEANPQNQGASGTPGGFLDNIFIAMFGLDPTDHGLVQYYTGYYKAVEQAMSNWVTAFYQNLPKMTMELDVAHVDQTQMLGQLMDRQMVAESETDIQQHDAQAHRRYQPSRLACDLDSTGLGLTQAYQISRAFNRGLALDDDSILANAKGSFSANGRNEDLAYMWAQYVKYFCDPKMGDQGCTTAGTMPDVQKNIGALLWGPQQTIDMTAPNHQSILLVQSALRYIIDPLVSDPVAQKVAETPAGHTQILLRRSQIAYVNDIYNVLGTMLSQRIGVSGIDVSGMETPAGVSTAETTPEGKAGASYSEIMQAMTRDRFEDPYYMMRMISDKSQVQREQLTLKALQLETMNDSFHRQEERLFLESAEYAQDLNYALPKSKAKYSPMK